MQQRQKWEFSVSLNPPILSYNLFDFVIYLQRARVSSIVRHLIESLGCLWDYTYLPSKSSPPKLRGDEASTPRWSIRNPRPWTETNKLNLRGLAHSLVTTCACVGCAPLHTKHRKGEKKKNNSPLQKRRKLGGKGWQRLLGLLLRRMPSNDPKNKCRTQFKPQFLSHF